MKNIISTDFSVNVIGNIVAISITIAVESDDNKVQVITNTINATTDNVDKIIKLLKKAKKIAKANR